MPRAGPLLGIWFSPLSFWATSPQRFENITWTVLSPLSRSILELRFPGNVPENSVFHGQMNLGNPVPWILPKHFFLWLHCSTLGETQRSCFYHVPSQWTVNELNLDSQFIRFIGHSFHLNIILFKDLLGPSQLCLLVLSSHLGPFSSIDSSHQPSCLELTWVFACKKTVIILSRK